MPSMNRVFLAGNLTHDPEIKQTSGGQSVSDLGLAINERFRNRDGEEVERTCFADIVVWGRQAQTCHEHLTKGSPILVEGTLQQDRWETDDGQKRSKLRIRALRVQFLGRATASDAAGGQEDSGHGTPAEGAENLPF